MIYIVSHTLQTQRTKRDFDKIHVDMDQSEVLIWLCLQYAVLLWVSMNISNRTVHHVNGMMCILYIHVYMKYPTRPDYSYMYMSVCTRATVHVLQYRCGSQSNNTKQNPQLLYVFTNDKTFQSWWIYSRNPKSPKMYF